MLVERTGRARDTYTLGEREGGEGGGFTHTLMEREKRQVDTHLHSGVDEAPPIILTMKVYSRGL